MTQPQNPYEPAPDAASSETGSPTSDPAQHPHDPFATPQQPQSAPQGQQHSEPSAQQAYGAPQDPPHEQQYAGAQQQAHTGQQYDPGAGAFGTDVPPTGIKGVHEGPLSGQPMQDSEARTWAMLSHLAALLQFVIPFIGGLVAQIVLYVVFKDRNRYVRYNAAESLNGTIAAVIASIVLTVLITILSIITFGLGAFLFFLVMAPQVLQAIFAIIGAVKANQGEWWNYPVNIRLVK